jgi:ADP-ribose pyrophosphatase
LALTDDNNVLLVKQFRPGPEKILLEMPGGGCGGDEPLEAAKRELFEETGYSGDIEFVCSSLDCAYSTMERYNFVVRNCKKITEPSYDENEFGEIIEMPLDDFRSLLRSGELTDVETGYLGLDYLGLL